MNSVTIALNAFASAWPCRPSGGSPDFSRRSALVLQRVKVSIEASPLSLLEPTADVVQGLLVKMLDQPIEMAFSSVH